MVIGAFAFCYLPAYICVVVTAKLGPSRVPIALRSTFVLMMAINGALNPIIYMFRSNEFKRAFSKIFRRPSIGPQIENNATVLTLVSRMEPSVCSPRNERLPSFLTVPNKNVTSPGPRIEVTAMACTGSDSSVEMSQEMQTTPFSLVMFTYDQEDISPSSLAVPADNTTSSELSKIGNVFDSRSNDAESIVPSCLEPSIIWRNERSLSFLGVPIANQATPETRSEVSLTASERSLNSIEVSQ